MPQPSLHQPKPQCIVGQLNNRRVGQLVKTTKRKLIMMGNHGSRHEELLSNQQIVPSTLLNTEPHEENSQTTCLSFPTVSLRRCLSQCRYSGAMASQDNPKDLQVMHRMVVSPSYAPCVTKRRVGHSTQRRVFSEITQAVGSGTFRFTSILKVIRILLSYIRASPGERQYDFGFGCELCLSAIQKLPSASIVIAGGYFDQPTFGNNLPA